MKISFCTTCMGRAHHLKETLPVNIDQNPSTDEFDVEFVVLNYNSKDDLHEWMTTDPAMKAHIESGLIRYGKTTEPEHFHMSHAKNMAHRMATGDFVCNLDADNFTGVGFASFLAKVFKLDPNGIVTCARSLYERTPVSQHGFGGRIALSKSNFLALHGYDEAYKGWGEEDNDLKWRAKGKSMRDYKFSNPEFARVLSHSDEARVENMVDSENELHRVHEKRQKNLAHIAFKYFRGVSILTTPVQCNPDHAPGAGNVELYDGQRLNLNSLQTEIMPKFYICALGLPELVRGRLAPREIFDGSEVHPVVP